MKAMVIYDSKFGNTAQIAKAIGDGLGDALGDPEDVEVTPVDDTQPDQLAGLDLLIFGAPTHGFRPSAPAKDFLKSIPKNTLKGVKVAAFDTRITEEEIKENRFFSKLVDLFGFAADPVSKKLEKKGGEVVMPPEGFTVEGTEGPLTEGELERAREWGRQIMTKA